MHIIAQAAPNWGFWDLPGAVLDSMICNPADDLSAAIAKLTGGPAVVVTNLGRTALLLGLRALGLEEGTGVIIPSLVCPAVPRAVIGAGLRPIVVDVGDDLHIAPECVSRQVLNDAKAIVVPHLYGLAAPIREIMKWAHANGLFVVDDAAQAAGVCLDGRYLGTFGDLGILSFGPFKSISCPRGGALLSWNGEYVARARCALVSREPYRDAVRRVLAGIIKLHGRPYYLRIRGLYGGGGSGGGSSAKAGHHVNEVAAMAGLEAAIVLRCVARAAAIVSRRRRSGLAVAQMLRDFDGINLVGPQDTPYVKIPIRFQRKMELNDAVSRLRALGVEAERVYMPLHLQPEFRAYSSGRYPWSEQVWGSVVLIPNRVNLPSRSFSTLRSCMAKLTQLVAK